VSTRYIYMRVLCAEPWSQLENLWLPAHLSSVHRSVEIGRCTRKGAREASTEGTMAFEYWLAAIAIGEMLLLNSLLRPERS
jgi:hypothetical protein